VGGLIKSEFRKLRSTQLWFWMLVAVVALAALFTVGQILSHDEAVPFAPNDVRSVFTSGQTAFLAALVLGVLGVTAEFRYQTITPTLLATPSRTRVITAKLVTYGLVGAAYSVVTLIVTSAIAIPWLNAKDVTVSIGDDHLVSAFVGVFFTVVLWGLVGLGFGALVRNQIVAMVVSIIYVIVVEPLLAVIPVVRNAYPYLPGGAAAAILDTTSRDHHDADVHFTLLSPALGCLVMLVWALGLAMVGAGLSMNRDIT
jgi:ABC-2 type transport system permease protein